MQKREPVIIAPDYTDDELYEWMRQKINAAQDLKWANETRAKQAENLSALEQDITNLEKAAALSIAGCSPVSGARTPPHPWRTP